MPLGYAQAIDFASSRSASLAATAAAMRSVSRSSSSLSPSPTTSTVGKPSGRSSESFLKPLLALSAPAAPAISGGSSPPSTSPTARRSVPTSTSSTCFTSTFIGREFTLPCRYRHPLDLADRGQVGELRKGKAVDAQLSDSWNRAHPLRKDGRRSLLPRRHRSRRHCD